MPYIIKWHEGGVSISFFGHFTARDKSAADAELYCDERSDWLQFIVWDLSGCDGFGASGRDPKYPAMVDKIRSHRLPSINMALVARSEEAIHFFKQYIDHSIQIGSPWRFQVFPDIDSAIAWGQMGDTPMVLN